MQRSCRGQSARGLVLATLALLVVFSFARPGRAQGIHVEGGSLDCGQWVTGRAERQSVVLEGFVIGLLNGLALGHAIEFWRADRRPVSREAVYLWLDGYCRNHPLDSIVTGAMDLYSERSGRNPK